MTEHQHRHTETSNTGTSSSSEDEAFLAAARRLPERLRHPFVIGFLAVAAAALLFRLGIAVGETVYLAFEGDGTTAAAFGGTFVTILVGLIGLGAWLDRRQRTRSAEVGPLTAEQRERVQDYLDPSSSVARWYRQITVVVFVALAAPGVLLLGDPWDGLWVLAVLIANPVGRWLRSQGHPLTTRDLGFRIPGLSPWPSIAAAALAVTAGMGIAVLLWAEALEGTVETVVTGAIALGAILAGGIAVDRHERRHLARLLDPGAG
jgi:hypothetical protein